MSAAMSEINTVWRSALFLPAHSEKFVASAHTRAADAYILDLEDSVPAEHKARAREHLQAAAAQVGQQGAGVLVRVNSSWQTVLLDLEAAISAQVSAIVLPKVNDAGFVRMAAAQIDLLEQQRGLTVGHTGLIAQIEDVQALPMLDAIATSSPRLLGMILGSEDFSVSAGMVPTAETLLLPNQLVQFACRRAGIAALGFPASIADYRDLDAFRLTIRRARQLGFVGAFCVHPTQVAILNEEFAPSAQDIEHAHGVIAAYEAGLLAGQGAVQYLGRMVDAPVAAAAQALLSRVRIL